MSQAILTETSIPQKIFNVRKAILFLMMMRHQKLVKIVKELKFK